MADTAVLDAQGAYVESCSKVAISVGRFPYAIGVTGNIHPRALLPIVAAANCVTLKQLVKRLPDILDDAVLSAAKTLGGVAPEISFKGIAWDFARKRPMGFQISNNRLVSNLEPYELYEVSYSLTFHDRAADAEQLLGGIDPTDPIQFDPDADGLRLIEEQRLNGTTSAMPGGAIASYTVGGEAQIYKITKHGVTCHALREWPDDLGKPIQPCADQ